MLMPNCLLSVRRCFKVVGRAITVHLRICVVRLQSDQGSQQTPDRKELSDTQRGEEFLGKLISLQFRIELVSSNIHLVLLLSIPSWFLPMYQDDLFRNEFVREGELSIYIQDNPQTSRSSWVSSWKKFLSLLSLMIACLLLKSVYPTKKYPLEV